MQIVMGNIERLIEQEVAAGVPRRSLALSYAFGIQNQQLGHAPDWARISRAILTRYRPSGLNWIKEEAWRLVKEKRAAGVRP